MENVIAMTYGKALFEAARELDRVCEIEEEIRGLDEIFRKEEAFLRLLRSPAVTVKEKKTLTGQIFGGRVGAEVLSFLYILIDHGRMGQYHAIVKNYLKRKDAWLGEACGKIWSASPLTEEELHRFEGETGRLLGKRVTLKNRIDPAVLGGVRVQVSGRLIDATVRSALEGLRDSLRSMQQRGNTYESEA